MRVSKQRGGILIFFTFLIPPISPFPSALALWVPGISGFSAEALGENSGLRGELSMPGMPDRDTGGKLCQQPSDYLEGGPPILTGYSQARPLRNVQESPFLSAWRFSQGAGCRSPGSGF